MRPLFPSGVWRRSALLARVHAHRAAGHRSAAGGRARARRPTRRRSAVKGSDTMVILGQRWAEDYMKANPGHRPSRSPAAARAPASRRSSTARPTSASRAAR